MMIHALLALSLLSGGLADDVNLRIQDDDSGSPDSVFVKPGLHLHDEPLEFQGVTPFVSFLTAASMDLDVSDLTDVGLDSMGRTTTVRYEYDEKDLEGYGIGAELEIGPIWVQIELLFGTFDGDGSLTFDNGVDPVTTTESDMDGDFFMGSAEIGWEGIGYRDDGIDVDVGPLAGVSYVREELDGVDGEPYDLDDTITEITIFLGLHASGRVALSPIVDFIIRIKSRRYFGDLSGLAIVGTIGIEIDI